MLAPSNQEQHGLLKQAHESYSELYKIYLDCKKEHMNLKLEQARTEQLKKLTSNSQFIQKIKDVLFQAQQYEQIHQEYRKQLATKNIQKKQIQKQQIYKKMAQDRLSNLKNQISREKESLSMYQLFGSEIIKWLQKKQEQKLRLKEQEEKISEAQNQYSEPLNFKQNQISNDEEIVEGLQAPFLLNHLTQLNELKNQVFHKEQQKAEKQMKHLELKRKHRMLRQQYFHQIQNVSLPPRQDLQKEYEDIKSSIQSLSQQMDKQRNEEKRVRQNLQTLAGGEVMKKVSLYITPKRNEIQRLKTVIPVLLGLLTPISKFEQQVKNIEQEFEEIKAEEQLKKYWIEK